MRAVVAAKGAAEVATSTSTTTPATTYYSYRLACVEGGERDREQKLPLRALSWSWEAGGESQFEECGLLQIAAPMIGVSYQMRTSFAASFGVSANTKAP